MNQDNYERELGERQVIDVVNARVHRASSYVSLKISNTKTRILKMVFRNNVIKHQGKKTKSRHRREICQGRQQSSARHPPCLVPFVFDWWYLCRFRHNASVGFSFRMNHCRVLRNYSLNIIVHAQSHSAHWDDSLKTTKHIVKFAKNLSAARMTTRSSIPYVKSYWLTR